MSLKVVNALKWLKSVLNRHQVPFQIVGGLAARIYGGTRPVADIDLYIPHEKVSLILPDVEPFIKKPFKHDVEEAWDLEYFQLIYADQKIEIALSPGTKIYNKFTGSWVEITTDFSTSIMGFYEGIELPIIPPKELIDYKSILAREVDLIDIEEVSKFIMNNAKETNR